MRVLDLFSGIGGFSLGLERAGMETVAFCEIEGYPRSILAKHWPDVPIHSDIRKLDGKEYRGTVDVICGGFPCQPFSVAGKQRGKEDDRHLWPEMFRIIKESRPTWVIGENVAGFIAMALDDVLSDLEGEGYETQSFVIPACAVGGIHRRDRVWIVAHSEGEQDRGLCGAGIQQDTGAICRALSNSEHNGASSPAKHRGATESLPDNKKGTDEAEQSKGVCSSSDVADTASIRQQGQGAFRESIHSAESGERKTNNAINGSAGYIGIPTQSPVRHRDDGLPDNVARLRALGNAVVPQIPEAIGRAIMEASK